MNKNNKKFYRFISILCFLLGLSPMILGQAQAQTVETLWVSIQTGPDDAEENVSSGGVSLSSTDLEFTQDGLKQQIVGLRFPLDIPAGATILNATIQFKVDEVSTESTVLSVSAEATINALPFITQKFDISTRILGSEIVSWTPLPWATVGETGEDQATSDLSTIVQEVVDQVGWVNGNHIAFILSGNGKRVAESFNGTAA